MDNLQSLQPGLPPRQLPPGGPLVRLPGWAGNPAGTSTGHRVRRPTHGGRTSPGEGIREI